MEPLGQGVHARSDLPKGVLTPSPGPRLSPPPTPASAAPVGVERRASRRRTGLRIAPTLALDLDLAQVPTDPDPQSQERQEA